MPGLVWRLPCSGGMDIARGELVCFWLVAEERPMGDLCPAAKFRNVLARPGSPVTQHSPAGADSVSWQRLSRQLDKLGQEFSSGRYMFLDVVRVGVSP
jgi:hypothetical protein